MTVSYYHTLAFLLFYDTINIVSIFGVDIMHNKRVFSVLLILILVINSLSGCSFGKPKEIAFSDECLIVYFFDVGQADSSLLLFPDGTVMLIDAGNSADGEEIAGFISNLGIETIDYFVCTHPHEDHIGGAADIFNEFDVKTVCMPKIDEEYLPDTDIYKSLMKAVAEENCKDLYLTAGTLIMEKDTCNVTSIGPGVNSVYSNMNDYSLTLLVNCYTNTLLFTGDAEKPSELDMLNSGINLDADILKVGHHGSSNSSTDDFLEAVTPKAAVISCGTGNTYGHPNEAALTRLNDIGANIYRTDTVGTVTVRCYDGGFNVETSNDIELDGNR